MRAKLDILNARIKAARTAGDTALENQLVKELQALLEGEHFPFFGN
jgi:hypothetical protein